MALQPEVALEPEVAQRAAGLAGSGCFGRRLARLRGLPEPGDYLVINRLAWGFAGLARLHCRSAPHPLRLADRKKLWLRLKPHPCWPPLLFVPAAVADRL